MPHSPLRIGIVAGEASGDILAAGMIKRILEQHPDAIVEGIAGPRMLEQGCKSLFDMEELSVMGLVEVLPKIKRLLHVRKTLLAYFTQNPPDVFIGVDAPDFNLRLEKKLKQQGIKTVHYVSPTIWAWREKRIFGIGEATNLVLSIFPMDKPYYDKYGYPCQYVGHTMADDIPLAPDKPAARQALGLDEQHKVLALLPGSRGSEVKSLLDIFLKSAALLTSHFEQLKVLIPAANDKRKAQIEAIIQHSGVELDIHLIDGQAREAMIASDAVLLASGTATLEAMLCKRPMVAAYRLSWLTHQMMKVLYKARFFTLPNLLADEALVPELLQQDVNPSTISSHLLPLLRGEGKQSIERFTELHKQLKQQADIQSANAVLELVKSE